MGQFSLHSACSLHGGEGQEMRGRWQEGQGHCTEAQDDTQGSLKTLERFEQGTPLH